MKQFIAMTALLLVGFSTYAKGGNIAYKNSMAGFAGESIEHSLLQVFNANGGDQVVGTSVELLSDTDSTVLIDLADGSQLTFNCLRFDDISRGGTVIKKEVVCRR